MNSSFLADYKYNYEENHLIVKTRDEINFDLKLRAPITIVEGNSATGKSYLVNKIEEINRLNEKLSKDKNVVIITSPKEFDLKDQKQLVIIDRADIWLTLKMQEEIKKCKESRFLIMKRGLHDFNLTPNYYATLVKENNVVSLSFEFSERLWFK